MKPPRLILFAARWAIMSGLAGTVFAILVFVDDRRATASTQSGGRPTGLLLAAAALLAVAFVLAPFVRRAFVRPTPVKRNTSDRKTLLDEMREEGGPQGGLNAAPESDMQQNSSPAKRLLIGLYVVFAATLGAVLWVL